jgi:uncharacterized protein
LRTFLFIFAWITFVLGFIGAFIPVLPTTPFLLLSAYFFSKSSPRFHAWLLQLPLAGQGIRDWNQYRVIRPKAKFLCVTMIILSLYFLLFRLSLHFLVRWPVSLILISVAIFVSTRNNKMPLEDEGHPQ